MKPRIPFLPPITALDELSTIKEVLLLNLLLVVFDRDCKVIQESVLKTKQPYIDTLQRAMDAVVQDLTVLRNRLRESGIKMTDERRDEQGVGCLYWCRGYKSSFEMLWHLAKAETEIRMRKYLGEDIRKYVRQDLPEHLQPKWLLAPAAQMGESFRSHTSANDQLGEGKHTRPHESSGHSQQEPIPIVETDIQQPMRTE
jgi:hypothetical protein